MDEPVDKRSVELIRRYRNGDTEAFRSLVDAHRDGVCEAIAPQMPGWLGRRVSVADVVQDACMIAFRRRADFQGESTSAFRRWLFGIARMRLLRSLQHHGGKECRDAHRELTRGDRPETWQYVARHEPSPSQHAAGHETEALLRRALDALTDDHKQVLRLLRDDGLPLADVARRMGRSEGAVRKLQGRALLELSRAFQRLRRKHDD